MLAVDATAPVPAPQVGYLWTGTGRTPAGSSSAAQTLAVNSRFLVLDGRPWLPVMGEVHYWRIPPQDWDEALAKVRAAGVDIVSTYVYWAYQEPAPGQFDWRGRHDLRRFVELCARHHLKVILRLGPWIHAETRFGGLPDWVVGAMPTRSTDPQFLHQVTRYFERIGAQMNGLLWKDGGPIIGVQLGNEYHLTGARRGRSYIAALRRLAVAAGFDVPLYTVTAWDNAIYPRHEVMPMVGGYPGLPWDTSRSRLPPDEVYAFRFRSRITGDASPAALAAVAAGDATPDAAYTPFLSAEYGGGLPEMYRRRSIVTADDIAAMTVVQIGSGVNLYGYYMFHGGTNPPGGPWEETTASGGYNDVPRIGYDFQAPIGAFGDERAVLGKLRMVHQFLERFGSQLAPMAVREPTRVPVGTADLITPRWSVRSLGDSGFLFFNNHIRGYLMAPQRVRFHVRLPDGNLVLPSTAIDIPPDSYFIWPLGMDLEGARLRYATAQPITALQLPTGSVYVFRAVPGIPVEMSFDTAGVSKLDCASGCTQRHRQGAGGDRILVKDLQPGMGSAVTLATATGRVVRLVVLPEAEAEHLWTVTLRGRPHLLLTTSQVFAEGGGLALRSPGDPDFRLELLPAVDGMKGSLALSPRGADGLFQVVTARAVPRSIPVSVTRLRWPRTVPPVPIGGSAGAAMQPTPETYGDSAAWSLAVPRAALAGQNAYLRIRYCGDVARLYAGTRLLDDDFYTGLTWQVGLKDFAPALAKPLTLTILPLRADAPIHVERPCVVQHGAAVQLAKLVSVKAVPVYRLFVR